MKISELLTSVQRDTLRDVAQINAHDFLCNFAADNGCKLNRRFWQNLADCYELSPTSVIVTIAHKRANAMVCDNTREFARHLGELLKQKHAICWLKKHTFVVVNWDNWKSVYAAIIAAPDNTPQPLSNGAKRAILKEKERLDEFTSLALDNIKAKPKKWKNKISYEEAKARFLSEENEKNIFLTIREAKTILGALC